MPKWPCLHAWCPAFTSTPSPQPTMSQPQLSQPPRPACQRTPPSSGTLVFSVRVICNHATCLWCSPLGHFQAAHLVPQWGQVTHSPSHGFITEKLGNIFQPPTEPLGLNAPNLSTSLTSQLALVVEALTWKSILGWEVSYQVLSKCEPAFFPLNTIMKTTGKTIISCCCFWVTFFYPLSSLILL